MGQNEAELLLYVFLLWNHGVNYDRQTPITAYSIASLLQKINTEMRSGTLINIKII